MSACLYTPEKHKIHIYYSRWEVEIIGGKSQEKIEVSIYPPYGEEGGRPTYMKNIESLPIEKSSSCPDNVKEPKLVIDTDGNPLGGRI